ncbi:hypothetical protein RRG08_027384 [Elysia crispata]|uniref:Uncharacterized protein n=1 Tax=Elysia crispata TaxID=231223 RepID=A0AAE1D1I8_9GAST|nr:hypothetical protein RRG08_027384 [Elysia crispata]
MVRKDTRLGGLIFSSASDTDRLTFWDKFRNNRQETNNRGYKLLSQNFSHIVCRLYPLGETEQSGRQLILLSSSQDRGVVKSFDPSMKMEEPE